MHCADIESSLSDYHFAQGSAAQLDQVHAHLLQCRDCTRSYLELKHAIDSGAAMGLRPSEMARARLRAAVRLEFRPTLLQRSRQWLGRPVPRYQVAMAASMLLVLAAGAVLGLRDRSGPGAWPGAGPGAGPGAWPGAGPGGPVLAHHLDPAESRALGHADPALRHGYEAVDTARPMAVSLTYY